MRNILSSGTSSVKLRATKVHPLRTILQDLRILTDTEAVPTSHMVWNAINLPNLRETSSPLRERATLIHQVLITASSPLAIASD